MYVNNKPQYIARKVMKKPLIIARGGNQANRKYIVGETIFCQNILNQAGEACTY